MRLNEILLDGESATVEFKRCGNSVERDVFETLCAFANRFGGDLYLGVDDDGSVIGIDGARCQESLKPSIGGEKPSIGGEKPSIDELLARLRLTQPTRENIKKLASAMKDGEIFGRSRIMEIVGLSNGPAGDMINTMLRNGLLDSVRGHGKGKYRFRI